LDAAIFPGKDTLLSLAFLSHQNKLQPSLGSASVAEKGIGGKSSLPVFKGSQEAQNNAPGAFPLWKRGTLV
jgi:hypothetical protein